MGKGRKLEPGEKARRAKRRAERSRRQVDRKADEMALDVLEALGASELVTGEGPVLEAEGFAAKHAEVTGELVIPVTPPSQDG